MAENDYSFTAFSQHGFYRKVNESLIDRAGLKCGWTVVDLACGTGAVTELILEKVRGARDSVVIGLDMSASALREAQEKFKGARDAVVEFVQARAEDMSGALKRAADAVVFCNGIHYFGDKRKLLAEVYRTLKPGGVFAFNTTFFEGAQAQNTEPFYRRWMMKALRKLKRDYGMSPSREKVAARKQLTPEQYRELIESAGFELRTEEMVTVPVEEQGWIDISRYSDFVSGALPGVPLSEASEVLCEALHETFAELELEAVDRNWLSMVAARP